ncbi:myoD family inhibitor domain-containing protein isoform X2 [Sinocyclocheilus rhinocerous]|uniref:myoD family inhibitor domain-containing protein isoform X2 n=1 Tax=Sinocyclocheilus rhinocerous TaxID=307959 RepID=UPI0007B994F5|nr:PREDICTED: myoD family inhibitor domain-containing protein isoform X2 [Sinocyclocheilus rhinocerous]
MSSETILPPEGPEGPKKQLQEETNPLLSKTTDKCNSCTDESSDATETSQTPIPGDATSDGQDHMTENHIHDDLVRTQPQPLPQLATSQQHGIDGEAGRQQNGLHTVLSNGHGTPRRVTQPPSTSPTSESRKHPSPVSHRVQRKLRSSLSVNSDSSRRSKSSSTGSHKPGSTPEVLPADNETTNPLPRRERSDEVRPTAQPWPLHPESRQIGAGQQAFASSLKRRERSAQLLPQLSAEVFLLTG